MKPSNDKLILWVDAAFVSPWVLTVWMALKEKGVPFEVKTLDLSRGEHREGDFATHAMTVKIPGITDGDFWLNESMAILEYLDDRFPAPAYPIIFPTEIRAHAKDRELLSWLRIELSELRSAMPFEGLSKPSPGPQTFSPSVTRLAEKLIAITEQRIATHDSTPLTIGDFELACTLRRLIHYGYDVSNHADIVAFSNRIWNRPSVQSWVNARPS